MKGRAFVPAAIAVAALAGAACKDPTAVRAIYRTTTDTMVAFAISGSSPSVPAALSLAGFRIDSLGDYHADPLVQRVDSIFDFDLAFDIDDAGTPVLLTPRKVGSTGAIRFVRTSGSAVPVGPQRVGLQVLGTGTSFESVLDAPTSGFVYDSLARVARGQPVVIQSYSSIICGGGFQPYVYAKIAVDSAIKETRKVYFRVTMNRNCGFRSFRPGIPND